MHNLNSTALLYCIFSTYRTNGRPRLSVSMDDVEFLRSLRFSWTNVANVLGISRSTLYRRLNAEGVSVLTTYTDISDSRLDRLVAEVKQRHPNDGEILMSGHLLAAGITVQRYRLRASIHRVDPVNTAARRSLTVRRRVYSVEGPNALWHLDGNHKLIRWRFVIHGAIDGYSRMVVFLGCSDNNRAHTVLDYFEEAVQLHGLPSKLRTDLGGENTEVWRYMVEQHHSANAVITGSSTHNERIERLWRDVHRCVGVVFADTFRKLEEEQHLDCLNELDLFCLHYVFQPRINSTLRAFVESWNNHPLSTSRNLTPNQLFIRGAIEYSMVPQVPQLVMPPISQQPVQHASITNHVQVPRFAFSPCMPLSTQLSSIDTLHVSNDFGCDIYKQVISIVGNHLVQGCTHCLY